MLYKGARAVLFCLLSAAVVCLPASALESTSPSFRNTRSSVDSGGRRKTSSPSFRGDASVGAISVSTGSSPTYLNRDGLMGIDFYPARVTGVGGSSGTAPGTVFLQWVAPGDDGVDVSSAGAFIVRYSSVAAQSPASSDAWFNAATNVTPAPPVPSVAGTTMTMTVTGLTAGVAYYFAIKAAERDGMRGVLSAGATVQSTPQAPALTGPAAGSYVSTSTPALVWSGTATYRVQLALDSGMTQVIADSITANAFYVSTNTLSHGTAYWWRVSSSFGPYWSAVSSFTVDLGSPTFSAPQISTNSATGPWTALPSAVYASSNVVNVRITVQDPNSGLLASTGLPNGLVGQWHLDEGMGTVALDASAQSINGSINGATYAAGKRGGALSFTGANSVAFSADPLTAVNNWTLSAWINPASLNQYGPLAVYDGNSGLNGYGFGIGNGAGVAGSNLSGLLGGVVWINSGYTFPTANAWYHVEMVRDNGTIKFYVNGVQTPNTSAGVPAAPSQFCIGCGAFSGLVDEVRAYNVARSPGQILADYQSDTLAAHDRSAAYNVLYSINAGITWTYVSTSAVTLAGATNGDTTARTLEADGIPLVTSTGLAASTNLVALVVSDMAGNVSTATYVVLVDTTGFSGRKNWTNATGDLNWYTAGNWSPAGAPGAGDAATIDRNDIVTVSASSPPVSFAELRLGGTNAPTLNISTGVASGGWLEVRKGATFQQNSTLTLTITSATIFSGGLLTHTTNPAGNSKLYILNLVTTGDFNLQAGATISVTGLGYAGGPPNTNGYGTGGGSYTPPTYAIYEGGGGGGHGGGGGYGYGSIYAPPGGVAYDTLSTPTDLGSGGGGTTYSGSAGAGGGAILLSAGGTLTLNGLVAADGTIGVATYSGGGAGGTINLTAITFSGSGTLSANGGPGYSGSYPGGGGGGGRIALSQTNCSSTLSINGSGGAWGGSGAQPGQPGTWYPYPPSLAGAAQGVSSITWTWGSMCNASTYHVLRASNNAVLATGLTSSWNDVNLATNTLYGLQVQGVNTTGLMSSLSPSTSFYTSAAVPGTPAQPFNEVDYTSFTINWLARGNPGYTQYFVQASTAADFTGDLFYPTAGAVWLTSVSTTVVGLANGVLYYVEVRAKNGDGVLTDWDVLGSTRTLIPNYPGCAVTKFVKSTGGYDATTIGGGVALLPTTLTGPACVVIKDAATYPEQVTVQGFTNNGSSITIFTDPAVGSHAVVAPNTSVSTAAFVIAQSSVNIFGIDIVPSVAVTYGVYASSAYVQLSSVNVKDALGWIGTAGIVLSSWTTVSYTSVTVGGTLASGFWLPGSTMTRVSYSSAVATNASNNRYALWLNGASSNTFTVFLASNTAGYGAYLDANAHNNTISYSTFQAAGPALYLSGASSNTITRSSIASLANSAAYLGTNANYNTISQSTMTGSAGFSALRLIEASSNTFTQSCMANPAGYGVAMTSSAYNTIIQSAMTGAANALYLLSSSSYNTITRSYMTNPSGIGVRLGSAVSNTIVDSYIQGSTAVYISGSTGTVIGGSVLVATNTAGSALQMDLGSVNLTLSSSVLTAPASGAAVYLDVGNSGRIVLSTNTMSGAMYGVYAAAQSNGTQLFITSNTIVPAVTSLNNTYGLYLNGLTTGATIQNNTVAYRTSGTMGAGTSYSLYIQSGAGLQIDHNRFNEPGMITGGSYIAAYFASATNTAFKFNDVNVVGTGLPNGSFYLLQLAASTVTVRNDVFSSSISFTAAGSSATLKLSADSGIDSDYNDYFSSNALNTFSWGAAAAQFQYAVGWLGEDAHSIAANPLWYNPAAGVENFHPLSSIGRCTNAPLCSSWALDGSDSPTIDAGDGAEPAGLVALEPAPNGSTANQGSTGETNEASKSPVYLSVTLSTGLYNFGTIDQSVTPSTVSVSSVIVTNSGNVSETYQLSAATVTPNSPWVLSQTRGDEKPVLQTLFNDVAPNGAQFQTVFSTVTGTAQASGSGGGWYAGDQTGKQQLVRANIGMWMKLTAPLSTIINGTSQTIRMTVTAIKDP